ncbi:hypothetical protein RB981_003682 [Vibrio cholerae]|nr:hypothetical protein [Vibrio cholerae]ELU8126835.1 hypothetical protein [Vibrio cholerae]
MALDMCLCDASA